MLFLSFYFAWLFGHNDRRMSFIYFLKLVLILIKGPQHKYKVQNNKILGWIQWLRLMATTLTWFCLLMLQPLHVLGLRWLLVRKSKLLLLLLHPKPVASVMTSPDRVMVRHALFAAVFPFAFSTFNNISSKFKTPFIVPSKAGRLHITNAMI